jgi:hypothetical protein
MKMRRRFLISGMVAIFGLSAGDIRLEDNYVVSEHGLDNLFDFVVRDL